jgi:hypothetical protein
MDVMAVLLLRQPAEVHTGPNGRATAPPRRSRDLTRRQASSCSVGGRLVRGTARKGHFAYARKA